MCCKNLKTEVTHHKPSLKLGRSNKLFFTMISMNDVSALVRFMLVFWL